MPSIVVTPAASVVDQSVGGPVIGGVSFRRPSTRTASAEQVKAEQELANGSLRTYYQGHRETRSLTFSKLDDSEVALLKAAVGSPFFTYRDDPTSSELVMTLAEDPSFDAVPGTFPIRFTASLSLKARDVTP